MSQTIRRKAPSVRKAAAQRNTAQKVRRAKARTGSTLDAIMAWLPFTEEQLHRVFLAMILGGAVVLAWIVASFAGVPAMASQQLAAIAGDAGFEVRRVDVRGVKHLNELKIYERVLAEKDRAMPLVDVEALRNELIQLSWVEDARVSRQLPDTLVIDIVERKPHAVLRKADRLVMIDATGHELETISPARARGKLVVSGPGAGKQVEALSALLETAPALKPQVREAEWIGNRRWNVTFRTGQVLALPEGAAESSKALMNFAQLDGRNRLLGGEAVAFDMRAPDRIYFRVPNRQQLADAAKAAAAASRDAPAKPEAAAKPAASAKKEEAN
ncbi:MAG: FtsQ-type POTRA domain-containing protein [Sphingomonadales bacterium]|nr:FtsQ-type POTRA domain-containing protein [Sphingomonadales bacterium]